MKNIILALSVLFVAQASLASSQGPGSYEQYSEFNEETCTTVNPKAESAKVELTFSVFKWSEENFYVNGDIFAKVNGVVHNMEKSDATRTVVKGKIYPQLSSPKDGSMQQVLGKLQGMNDSLNFTFAPQKNSYTEFADDSSAFRGYFINNETNEYTLLLCKVDGWFTFAEGN